MSHKGKRYQSGREILQHLVPDYEPEQPRWESTLSSESLGRLTARRLLDDFRERLEQLEPRPKGKKT